MYRFNFYKRSLRVGKVAIIFLLLLLVYFFFGIDLHHKIALKLKWDSSAYFAQKSSVARPKDVRSFSVNEPATSYDEPFELRAVLIFGDQKYAFLKRGLESYTVKEGMLIGKIRIESITEDSIAIIEWNRKSVIRW